MNYFSRFYKRLMSHLDSFIRGERDFDAAVKILPFFYYLLFFSAFTYLEGLNYVIAQGGGGFDPRWPLFWSRNVDFATVATTIFIGWTLAVLAAAVFPFSRSARIAAFIGTLSYHAYMSSFGGPNHQFDHLLWISFIFVFLPTISSGSVETRRAFSLVFWCAQAFMLLTYSMAGVLKISYGIIQSYQGMASAFSIDAGALHVASQLLRMDETTVLGPFIVANPSLAFLPFLAVLYIQLFSIVAVFRPDIHRLWGILLILFHVGTFLTMRAVFTAPTVLLMILLLSSPFAPDKTSLRLMLSSLPLVPSLQRAYAALRSLMHYGTNR